MGAWNFLLDVVVLLGACLLLGAVATRFRQSPLVGYLIAGAALGGPGSLGIVQSGGEIETIAELGVALLLFSLGLEFSWRRLLSLGFRTLVVGAAQVVVTLMVAAGVAMAFSLGPAEAIVVGSMIALSSTACVLRILMDRGEIDSVHGRNSVGILLVQDIAVVPLALVVTLLASEGSALDVALEAGKILLLVLGLIAGLWLTSRLAVWILGTMALVRNRELGTLLAIVVGLGSAWAAHAAGTSPALGAFIAGMFLGASPFATQVRSDVASLRVVLLTLFFGAVGMVADPVWIARNWMVVIGVTALVLAGKAAIVWLVTRLARRPHAQGIATGLCVAQIGEFAFVLGGLGRGGGLLGETTYLTLVSSTILTLFVSPYLIAVAPVAGVWVERRLRGSRAALAEGGSSGSGHPAPDVVIIGLGPAGQTVARALAGSSLSGVVVDLNARARDLAETVGFGCVIGDATLPETLEHAGVTSASVVVVSVPAPSAAVRVIENVRTLAPGAHIVARSRYHLHAQRYQAAGARTVVDDEYSVGEDLADHVLDQLGITATERERSEEPA